jgi:competence protein ComGC
MEEMMKRQVYFYSDSRGFSTTIDVLIFLVLISIASLILLPTITGNIQVKSVIDSKSQAQSSRMLTTILNGRIDEFEYTTAGEQLDAIAGPINDSSLYITGKKLILGRELKHRTFADIAAEDAAAQWVIYQNGKSIQLNFLMTNYTNSLESTMKEYLDGQIADRYSYNLTVVWRPIVNVPVGSDVRIGEEVPDYAYVETAYITMPYSVDFSRQRVEMIVNENFNTTFGNISSTFANLKKDSTNRMQIEGEISKEIFDSINITIDEAVVDLVDETMGPVIDEGQDTVTGQINNLLPEGGNELIDSINETIISTLEEEGIIVNGSLSDTFKSYLKEVAKEETRRVSDGEIRAMVTELSDMYVNDVMTIEDVRESIYTEVFSRISVSRAEVTLSIWGRRG